VTAVAGDPILLATHHQSADLRDGRHTRDPGRDLGIPGLLGDVPAVEEHAVVCEVEVGGCHSSGDSIGIFEIGTGIQGCDGGGPVVSPGVEIGRLQRIGHSPGDRALACSARAVY